MYHSNRRSSRQEHAAKYGNCNQVGVFIKCFHDFVLLNSQCSLLMDALYLYQSAPSTGKRRMAEIAAWDALPAGQCESAAYCEADNLYRAEGNQALQRSAIH